MLPFYTLKSHFQIHFKNRHFRSTKKRCLLKFMICSTDDTLIETIGPYLSNRKNSDAEITMDILKNFMMLVIGFYQKICLLLIEVSEILFIF